MMMKPNELPSEVVELYNDYIHGGMSRREFFLDAQQRGSPSAG